MVEQKLETPVRIFGKANSLQDLINDLKIAVPQFIRQDEEGNDVLITATHNWLIVYSGKHIVTPAVLSEDGETIITPAVLTDEDRFDVWLLVQSSVDLYNYLKSNGQLDGLPGGSTFISQAPITPNINLA